MPAATNVKRVKGVRIERPFIIGSEAWPLDDSNRKPDTPPEHTKGWRVYVRAPDGQPDMTRWLKKVQFKIYHTYANATRQNTVVDTPPFQITETGWGGFNVEIRLFFPPDSLLKPEYRTHFLQLEKYGDEAQQAVQEREGIVRSEFLEYAEFNEPAEAFYEGLVDEAQWPAAVAVKKEKGKGPGAGRGKKGDVSAGGGGADSEDAKTGAAKDALGTVVLPPVGGGGKGEVFTRQLEQEIVNMLRKAEKEVEDEIEAVVKERKRLAEELAVVRAG